MSSRAGYGKMSGSSSKGVEDQMLSKSSPVHQGCSYARKGGGRESSAAMLAGNVPSRDIIRR